MTSLLSQTGRVLSPRRSPQSSSSELKPSCQICRKKLKLGSHDDGRNRRQRISSCRASSAESQPNHQSTDAQKPDDAVQAALKKVNEAVHTAERQLDKLDKLPSARMSRQAHPALQLAVKALLGALAITGVYQSQLYAFWLQYLGATIAAVLVGAYGFSRSSLSSSGALAAMFVGASSLACSWRMGITLLAFFGASSRLTQFREELKDVDESHRSGGQRDWQQVSCNALVPTVLALVFGYYTGCKDIPLSSNSTRHATAAMGGYLGYYACCCADTWASELGQLSQEEPKLITSLRPVRKGTNGGVTWTGFAASLAGGLFMGLVFWSMGAISPRLYTVPFQQEPALGQWSLVLLGAAAGLLGSLLDSVLGATVQFTGFNRQTQKVTSKPGPDVVHISGHPLLTNNLVNLTSASMVAALTSWAVLVLY